MFNGSTTISRQFWLYWTGATINAPKETNLGCSEARLSLCLRYWSENNGSGSPHNTTQFNGKTLFLAKGARRPFAPASGCVFAPDSRSRPPPHGVPGQKNLAHKSSTKNLRISENLKPRTVTARNLLILL